MLDEIAEILLSVASRRDAKPRAKARRAEAEPVDIPARARRRVTKKATKTKAPANRKSTEAKPIAAAPVAAPPPSSPPFDVDKHRRAAARYKAMSDDELRKASCDGSQEDWEAQTQAAMRLPENVARVARREEARRVVAEGALRATFNLADLDADGAPMPAAEAVEHAAVAHLRRARNTLLRHARRGRDRNTVAVAHIVASCVRAIELGAFEAIHKKKGMHAIARSYLKTDGPFDWSYIPTEHARRGDGLSGGFRMLQALIVALIEAHAQRPVTDWSAAVDLIASSLTLNFPGVAGLASIEPDDTKGDIAAAWGALGTRLVARLPILFKRYGSWPDRKLAAEKIARELLSDELTASGLDDAAIASLMRFLDS